MRIFAVRLFALSLPFVCSCGGTHYAMTARSTASRLEEARELGADRAAPYEYYYAQAHLEQAAIQAREASYSSAAELVDMAGTYAEKAIELTLGSRASQSSSDR